MEVGIKAGYGVDLTDRDIDSFGERVDLLRRQVAEIPLYFSKFFEHDARDSALSDLRSNLALREARARML